jgi:hypothetical protein
MRKTELLWIAIAAGLALYLWKRGGACTDCAAGAAASNYTAYSGPYRDWQ